MQTKFNENVGFSPEENLKRMSMGAVLFARDVLKDPSFDSTIVLVCAYNEIGAYGLILNRRTHMPLSEIFDGISGLHLKREIFIGGPVRQNELQIIQLTDTPVGDAVRIAPRVYMGGKWDNSIHMIESDPLYTRLFLGYSGWSPGQIEDEILAGAWDVYQVNLETLFSDLGITLFSSTQEIAEYLRTLSEIKC